MAKRKVPPKKKPAARKAAPKRVAQEDTVTCPHCRYERPAKDEHCHICGYPFPWTEDE